MVKRQQNMEILHFTVPNLLRIAYTIKFYIQKKFYLKNLTCILISFSLARRVLVLFELRMNLVFLAPDFVLPRK